jgi:guanylate kinase
MGRIIVLSGPSGVGKTTLLTQLFGATRKDFVLVPRYTDRPQRHGEEDGFENYYVSHKDLLTKVFANDFIHIEKWGDYYSAVESRAIEDVLDSSADGVVLTSIFGAARLRATYGHHVSSLYLWTDARPSLRNPRCLDSGSPEVVELKWRIRKKLIEDGFSEYETSSLTEDAFLEKRMVDNYLDIAAVNGRLRAGEDVKVIANRHDALESAVGQVERWRQSLRPLSQNRGSGSGGCFVLMPFKQELRPIYEDHLVKVCKALSISVTRADQIFATGPVMDQVREQVSSARYVIADLTDNNPNVFYELGICHAIGKQVVLMTQNTEVPFDVRHLRHIRYQYTPRGMLDFEDALMSTLQALQDEV